MLKFAYRSTRNLPDRILHRRRHREVRARLSRVQRPREILVVCYGNVCRSPYLQAVLQRALPDLAVKSAGFFGSDRAVPEISVALSAKRGLDLSRYRSRPLTQSTVGTADLVIVMDSGQARQLGMLFPRNRAPIVVAGDLDPKFDSGRGITDPWNGSSDVFESSFNRLDRCAATLVSVLQRRNEASLERP
ncbi:MAG: Phosphotyrosine protein phosphatase superfamily [Gemmatimonadales bacterium]|jgi:protein-tyrosine phosphatase|nr:Phosphotyrosine protein phosphatase superfamily [Gemmatimonadales bacterium]